MAPMVALWDDHESSNDSWEGGAQNQQPDKEGDWNLRRAAAMQVYREWMPVSDEPRKAYPIGTLATLYRTESRLLARTKQADIDAAFKHVNHRLGAVHLGRVRLRGRPSNLSATKCAGLAAS